VRVASEPAAMTRPRIVEEELADAPSERAGRRKTTY
jgi:hypothetical protein